VICEKKGKGRGWRGKKGVRGGAGREKSREGKGGKRVFLPFRSCTNGEGKREGRGGGKKEGGIIGSNFSLQIQSVRREGRRNGKRKGGRKRRKNRGLVLLLGLLAEQKKKKEKEG